MRKYVCRITTAWRVTAAPLAGPHHIGMSYCASEGAQ